jgi:citrate lyase beta subunit
VTGLHDRIDRMLAGADVHLAQAYPGSRGSQPVHTVYVPADRYEPTIAAAYGEEARSLLDAASEAVGADASLVERVRSRLARQPVDDLRIDFEDGYGFRPDEEEDAAVTAATQPPVGVPASGIRFKSLEAATRRRGLRTLERFLAEGGRGVLTLPKVTSVEQVRAMVAACEHLEEAYGLSGLRFEIQVETPQAVLGADGTAVAARMIHAAAGRVTGLHYGTYDYSAALGIAPAQQSLDHPVADHAKAVLQVAAAGTGVFVSDGSTNVIPVGEHRSAAWQLHARLVRRSLERGLYQGWDLHPAQLPTRFLATFGFFRDGLQVALDRLQRYLDRQESGYLDEPATAAALADYVLRALECGAVDPHEVPVPVDRLVGLTRRSAT